MDELLLFSDNPIDRFTDRFGSEHGHLEMAYHAALPLALTPDLLYLIWANFRLDAQGKPLNVQWVTVADLILSPLCREIRHETYVMETAVRQQLLNRMAQDERFGPEYILRLGQFIQHYASQFIQSDIPSLRQYAQAQQWAAQAYTEPDRLIESLANEYSQPPNNAETMRLAELLNTFSEPLNLDWVPTTVETAVNYDRLHTFGDSLAKFVRGDSQTATRQLRRLLGPARELNIGTMAIPVPAQVSQALASQEDKIYTYRVRARTDTTVTATRMDEKDHILSEATGQLSPPELIYPVQMVRFAGTDITTLNQLLNDTFSLVEFEGLISSLELNLEMLTNTPSKGGRIREAVQHLHRHQRLDELINLVVEARPDVDWDQIAQLEAQTTREPAMFTTLLQAIESGQADKEQLRQFGQHLFAILFDNDLQIDFLSFYETAVNDNAFLRLELQISHFNQDLTLLPWELLCLPDDTGFGTDWLAAAPEILFSRRPSPSETHKPPHFLPANEPIRIALVSGPNYPIDAMQLKPHYRRLVQNYPGQFELLPPLENPTAESLENLLAQQPHIVHFLALSRQVSQTSAVEGQLFLLVEEVFDDMWKSGREFLEILNKYTPALVILQSDVDAKPEELRGLQDVAATISRSAIPAVLGWTLPLLPVFDLTVAKFIHTVFPALAQGMPLDEAVQNGRRALLHEKNPLAFAAPSLFANAIVRRRTASEPVPPTLPHSLSVSVGGRSDPVFLLKKGETLPAVSEPITLRDEQIVIKANEALAYQGILLFQGEPTNPQENIMLGEILLDDDALYEGVLEIEAEVSVDSESTIHFVINHQSGFTRELTLAFQDKASNATPHVIDFQATIERYTRGVSESANLINYHKIDSWLSNANADRVLIMTGEDGAGKTTIAAQLARLFLGEVQPPDNLMGLAVTTTSSFFFCEPFSPSTLDPRSFALTIASQWAGRDSHFAYLQSTIDNHEEYELDELIERLLIRPFTDIDELIYPGSIIFLVDDLEAALQHPGETTIVDVILRMLRELYGVRFLLTAQMQPAVRNKLADVAAEFIHLGDRYDNFDIHIGQPLPGPDMRYPIVVSSETSGRLQDIEQTFSPVAELGNERLAQLRDLASNPEEAIEIGQRLFNVLMRKPNYEMVRRSLDAARNRGKNGLRLRVQFDDPTLQSYPWELCHDGRSFIFNNPDQPILLQRTVGTENVQTPPPLPRPVRLLVTIAAPVDQGRDDVEMQEKVIRSATEEVVTSSELDLQIIRHTTVHDLESAVQSYQPHIVQFIGHNSRDKEGVLILENESGRSNLVPVAEITRILAMAPVQCVILSPIGVGETAVTQLAPPFIQQGIPTVLAEQFVLPDQPAIEFWRAFYRALLFDRLSFEEAVWHGRNHLATTHREPFWGYTTIFARQLASAQVESKTEENDITNDRRIRVPNLFFDEESENIWVFNELISQLTPLELRLFKKLYNREGEIVTKEDLVSAGWPDTHGGVSDDAVNSAISTLRRKIEPDSHYSQFLSTIYGQGYRLNFYFIEVADEILLKPLFFNVSSKKVWVYGKPTTLTKPEFRLFNLLYTKTGEVVTKEELIKAGWPNATGDISEEAIIAIISWLREKIEPEPSNPRFILTAPNEGYILIDNPQPENAS